MVIPQIRVSRQLACRLGIIASCAVAALVPVTSQAQALVPGSAGFEPTKIRFGTMEYALTIVRGDEEESYGTLRDEIMPLKGNEPLLRRVLTLTRTNQSIIDSTLTDLETLAPRWHRSIQSSRTIDLELEGTRVRGSVVPKGAAKRNIDTTLADLAFDSSNWDLIIRTLPLAEGDAAVISVYDIDENLHRYSINVIDRQVRGKTDVIHVKLDMGKGREAHVWFDDATRVLLRIETQLGPDTLLRQVLKGQ